MDNATTASNAANSRSILAITEEFLGTRPSKASAFDMLRSFDRAVSKAERRPEGRPEPEEIQEGRKALLGYLSR